MQESRECSTRKNRKSLLCRTPGTRCPKKRALIKEMCRIAKLKQSRSSNLKAAVQDLRVRYGSLRSISRQLGLTWGEMQNVYLARDCKKAKYDRKLSKEVKDDIEKFFLEGPVCIFLPEAQYSKRVFLNRPIKEICELFNSQRGEKRKVAFSTFAKYRPKKVKLQRQIPLNSCLCEVCANFKLLSKALIAARLKNVLSSNKEAVKATICDYEHLKEDPDRGLRAIGRFGYCDCIFRQCNACGVKKIKSKIELTNQELLEENRNVVWYRWESVKKIKKTRSGKSKPVTRVERVTKTGSMRELSAKYLNALNTLSSHVFLSRWQYERVVELHDHLPEGLLLCSHDFAKNITCYAQQEVQAGFYDHTLVTLHPSVVFFKCKNCCKKTVRLEVINLSKILSHNASGFNKFHKDAVMIAEAAAGSRFKVVVNVTDQAPNQYKNRNSFLFTSKNKRPLIHFFLGSRHGKLWSDQASGRFLLFLRQAIASERVHVASAKDIATFAQEHYATPTLDSDQCQHFRIKINLVTRIPTLNSALSVTAERTRDIHMLRNTGTEGIILTRTIGCLCLPCISGQPQCVYPEYYKAWDKHSVSESNSTGGIDLWPLQLDCREDGQTSAVSERGDRENTGLIDADYSGSTIMSSDVEFDSTVLDEQTACSGMVTRRMAKDVTGDLSMGTSLVTEDVPSSKRVNESPVLHGDAECDSTVLAEQTGDSSMVTSLVTEDVPSSKRVNELPVLHGDEKSWSQVLLLIKKIKSYKDLVHLCKHLILPPLPNDFKGKYDHCMDSIDAITHDLLNAAKIPTPKGFVPVDTIADGNCLPRVLSKIIFDTECNHGQMRVRLIRDGVLNENRFLNNDHLKIGASPKVQNTEFIERYCTYSDYYNPCNVMTKQQVRRLYRKEWFEFRHLGRYSGVFQLHSAANILQTKVQSYYPDTTVFNSTGFNSVYDDLNRLFYPLGSSGHDDITTSHIVWTKSCSTVQYLQHFVPLLKAEK